MKKESVKKNFIYQSAYQLFTILLPMILSPYISRVLQADGLGIYSYTFSIVSYFVLVAKLGIENYGNRCIATIKDDKNKLNQMFSDIYSLHIVVTLATIVMYVLFVVFFTEKYKLVFAIQGAYLVGQLLDINWFFFGIEKFRITVSRNFFIKLLTVVCIFVFVRSHEDVWKYILILAVGSVLSELCVWLFVRQYVRFVKPDFSSYKTHFVQLLIFFIPAIAVSLYKVMDKVMLGLMTSEVQVGLYENSEKIVNISIGFITALGMVMMPRMTNLIANGHEEEGKKLLKKSMQFILLLSYAMCFGIIGISRVFPTVFWGDSFEQCGFLLVGLAFSLPFTAVASVIRTQYLMPKHRDKDYILSVCMGAGLNLLVNISLIPFLLSFGAVLGTLCAEAIVCIVQIAAVRKEFSIFQYLKVSSPYLIIGLIMMAAVYGIGLLMGTGVITLLVQIGSGMVIYGGLSAVYMYVTKDELLGMLMSRFIKKKHKKGDAA